MKPLTTVLTVLSLLAPATHAANPQDMQAEMKKMQASQAKLLAAMMMEKPSRLGFNETVDALQHAAKKRGWEVGSPMDMQAVMMKAGHKDAKPFKMLTMCKKDLVEALIKTQMAQKALPFAPCRLSVFESNDGKIYIAKPNTELMAQMAAPAFAPLLKQLLAEEQQLLSNITE